MPGPLPLCHLAGSLRIGDAAFQEVFHPIAERLLEHCDAVLRTGALIPAAIVHALLNLTTIAAVSTGAPVALRTGLATAALLALVAGTILAGARLRILRRFPSVLDLRAT